MQQPILSNMERQLMELDRQEFIQIEHLNILIEVLSFLSNQNDKSFQSKNPDPLVENLDNLNDLLLSQLKKLVLDENLMKLWTMVIDNVSNDKDLLINHTMSLLHMYRYIWNCYQNHTLDIFDTQVYNKSIMKALVQCLKMNMRSRELNHLSIIIKQFNNNVNLIFIIELFQDIDKTKLIINVSEYDWIVAAIRMMFKYYDSFIDLNESFIINILMRRLIELMDINEVIDSLILYKHSSLLAAKVITTSLINYDASSSSVTMIPVLLDHTITLWGDNLFISKANKKMMYYLNEVLITILTNPMCQKEHLSVIGARNISIELQLTIGISNYLDVDTIQIRRFGMIIAQLYAKLLGQELLFPELDDIEDIKNKSNNISNDNNNSNVTNHNVTKKNISPLKHTTTSNANTTTTTADIDNDSDSEIEGHSLEDEEQYDIYTSKDRILRTNYLRDCLIMLRISESKPEARSYIQAALKRIPSIMKTYPADGNDLCIPIIKELLISSVNKYNIDNYDELKAIAMLSIINTNIAATIPCLTEYVLNHEIPLVTKLSILDWLASSAKELSSIPTTTPTTTHINNKGNSIQIESIDKNNNNNISNKINIKKPIKLANLKMKMKYFKNNFQNYSFLYIYPIMKLLSKCYHNTLNISEINDNINDNFNIINDLFNKDNDKNMIQQHNNHEIKHHNLGIELEHLQGIDAILPSKCLLLLATLTHCCIHTNNQMKHAIEILKVANAYKSAIDISIRRAALITMSTSLESYIDSCKDHSTHNSNDYKYQNSNNNTPLKTLLNLSSLQIHEHLVDNDDNNNDHSKFNNEILSLTIMSEPLFIQSIDWIATTWKEDPDDVSRMIKQDILHLALNHIK